MTLQKWIDATAAIGITSKAGRYGGTDTHKKIAFEFASWISVEFKLYLVKEFGWDINKLSHPYRCNQRKSDSSRALCKTSLPCVCQ